MRPTDDKKHARAVFRSYLRANRLLLTGQRQAVLDQLVKNNGHCDVDELVETLRRRQVKTSRATVYRTVTLLERSGLIRKEDFGHSHSHYEWAPAAGHHEHLVCTKCGKIVEFTSGALEQEIDHVAARHRFRLLRHSVQLFGVCGACHE